ncbi:MAG: hypothetical protein R3C68_12125 [Myxococcota bacterium]
MIDPEQGTNALFGDLITKSTWRASAAPAIEENEVVQGARHAHVGAAKLVVDSIGRDFGVGESSSAAPLMPLRKKASIKPMLSIGPQTTRSPGQRLRAKFAASAADELRATWTDDVIAARAKGLGVDRVTLKILPYGKVAAKSFHLIADELDVLRFNQGAQRLFMGGKAETFEVAADGLESAGSIARTAVHGAR